MSEASSNEIAGQTPEFITQQNLIRKIKPIFRHDTILNPGALNYYISKRIETKRLSLERDLHSMNIKEQIWRKFEVFLNSTKKAQIIDISITSDDEITEGDIKSILRSFKKASRIKKLRFYLAQ